MPAPAPAPAGPAPAPPRGRSARVRPGNDRAGLHTLSRPGPPGRGWSSASGAPPASAHTAIRGSRGASRGTTAPDPAPSGAQPDRNHNSHTQPHPGHARRGRFPSTARGCMPGPSGMTFGFWGCRCGEGIEQPRTPASARVTPARGPGVLARRHPSPRHHPLHTRHRRPAGPVLQRAARVMAGDAAPVRRAVHPQPRRFFHSCASTASSLHRRPGEASVQRRSGGQGR